MTRSTGEQSTAIGDAQRLREQASGASPGCNALALPSQGVTLGCPILTGGPTSRLTARPRASWGQLKPDVQRLVSPGRPTIWDPATAALIEWFLKTPPPAEPFELYRAVTILRPARYWRYLEADILAGPCKARAYTKALQRDLHRLGELFGGPVPAEGR